VRVLDERRSRWVVRSPLGTTIEWDAEIVDDFPGRGLTWRSLPGSEVVHTGSVELLPGSPGRGTAMRAHLRLLPPSGGAGKAALALLRPVTELEIREDLRRFKRLMEAGEIPSTSGQPHGERSSLDPVSPF
jgi:uncharacterized membrane protein